MTSNCDICAHDFQSHEIGSGPGKEDVLAFCFPCGKTCAKFTQPEAVELLIRFMSEIQKNAHSY